MTNIQKANDEILASLVMGGDISRLTPAQKISYYKGFCERLGLDPLAQPFKILKLQGKEVLYCDRSGAQQLNKIHNVSHKITAREVVTGCYVVTAQASTPDNRVTESIGAVPIENLKGEALCNAMMKAETKAKRRATLDLLGLGFMDETEVETIPNAQVVDVQAAIDRKPLSKEDIEVWQQQINAIDTVRGLKKFYDDNIEACELYDEIKELFTARKEELKQPA